MCGRYVSPAGADLASYWSIPESQRRNLPAQRRIVSPAAQVPIVYMDGNRLVQIDAARWGLIPVGWKQARPPTSAFNARLEEAAAKRMWRAPLKSARCLVPAMGWYQWKPVAAVDDDSGEASTVQQPWFMHLPDNRLMHFAGLMSKRGEGDAVELSCAILTRAAAGPARAVDGRMPVVLAEAAYRDWLDRRFSDSEKSLGLAEDNALTAVELHPVRAGVNASSNPGVDLNTPFPNPA